MRNSLNGIVYDYLGDTYMVKEGYARKDHPPFVYQQDKTGKWRCYHQTKRGSKTVFRSFGILAPGFVMWSENRQEQ